MAYLPGRRLAGLSKVGRVVDAHARRLQTQERLTSQIVETLVAGLEPRGVLAVLEAERQASHSRSQLRQLAANHAK